MEIVACARSRARIAVVTSSMPMPESLQPAIPTPSASDQTQNALGGGQAPSIASAAVRRARFAALGSLAPASSPPQSEEREPDNSPAPIDAAVLAPQSAPGFDETEVMLWRTPSVRFDHDEFDQMFALWKQNSDPRLRERLILMHRNLVTFLARRFAERGEMLEDIMQVGMLGLIHAIDTFDPARGLRFSTFAIPTIAGEMRRYFRDKVNGMRVPRRLHDLYGTLQSQIEHLTQQLDRSPTYSEIASSLQIDVEEVVEALELGAVLDPNSLDQHAFDEEEGTTLADQIGAPDPHLHAIEEYSTLQAALEQLDPKMRQVLELTYFQGYSQADVARQMSVSQMYISRLLRRALTELRALLDEV